MRRRTGGPYARPKGVGDHEGRPYKQSPSAIGLHRETSSFLSGNFVSQELTPAAVVI
jgi:hypothetical protein